MEKKMIKDYNKWLKIEDQRINEKLKEMTKWHFANTNKILK